METFVVAPQKKEKSIWVVIISAWRIRNSLIEVIIGATTVSSSLFWYSENINTCQYCRARHWFAVRAQSESKMLQCSCYSDVVQRVLMMPHFLTFSWLANVVYHASCSVKNHEVPLWQLAGFITAYNKTCQHAPDIQDMWCLDRVWQVQDCCMAVWTPWSPSETEPGCLMIQPKPVARHLELYNIDIDWIVCRLLSLRQYLTSKIDTINARCWLERERSNIHSRRRELQQLMLRVYVSGTRILFMPEGS